MSDLKNDFKEIGSAFKKVAKDVVDKAEEVVDEYDLDEKAKIAGKAITDTFKTVAKELGEVASTAVNAVKENQQKKKEMNFKSIDELNQVIAVVNESAAALEDKSRVITDSPLEEVIAGALGAGIGGAGSFLALFALGVNGLSAVGISSGLAAAGALVGGGMAAGIFVLAAPVAALAGAGILTVSMLKSKQLREEKERLYEEAVRKHEGIIKALEDEHDADQARLDHLQGLNVLLQHAITDLKEDIDLGKVI